MKGRFDKARWEALSPLLDELLALEAPARVERMAQLRGEDGAAADELTDLLAQYKIPVPDDSKWTWDDLKAIGAEISKASGGKVTGVQSWGFDSGGVNIWARQAGAALYDADGKVAIPPDVLASYWQYLLDLAKQGIAPAPSVTVERAGAPLDQSGTATNTSAFGTWWNTQLTSLSAASGQNLKLLKLPGNGQPAAATAPTS